MTASEKLIIYLCIAPIVYYIACFIYAMVCAPPELKGRKRLKKAFKAAFIYLTKGGQKADEEIDANDELDRK